MARAHTRRSADGVARPREERPLTLPVQPRAPHEAATRAGGCGRHTALWGPVVRLAGAAGLVQLGHVSTEGTKIRGNASRHKAMRYGYRTKAVERLREEIAALVTAAYQQAEAAAAGEPPGRCVARRAGAP